MMNQPIEGVTLGEMARAVTRIETAVNLLSGQMQTALGPISILVERVSRLERDLNEMGEKLDAVRVRSDRISGAVALAAFALSFVPLPWKR